MPLVLSGATSGSTTLQASDTVTATATLPATTGTLALTSGFVSGSLVNIQYFTNAVTPQTYTPTAGTNFVIVEVVGGGGGSGGSGATAGFVSGGGGGGGFSRKKITSAFSGVTVTVGAGGTAGASGGAGGNGGTSSFGSSLCQSTGGLGGAAGTSLAKTTTGGTGSLGDINLVGGSALTFGTTVQGGLGGSSFYGFSVSNIGNANGVAGQNYGSGAAGSSTSSVVAYTGAAGGQGIVIVYEYA